MPEGIVSERAKDVQLDFRKVALRRCSAATTADKAVSHKTVSTASIQGPLGREPARR